MLISNQNNWTERDSFVRDDQQKSIQIGISEIQ